MLKAVRFRVQNFRNIDDSGWIKLERVTAFVGRNESGKTALLQALHKFNPASPEDYDPQREFPRDRYTHEFKNPADWPVCSVVFEIGEQVEKEMQSFLEGVSTPKEAICTRYYDGELDIAFEPALPNGKAVKPASLVEALENFVRAARRLTSPAPEQEEKTQTLRTKLALWASNWQKQLEAYADLRAENAVAHLSTLDQESEVHANPQTADMIETLQKVLHPTLDEARQQTLREQAAQLIEDCLPVFIYFENYGILKSAIYLPRFLEDLVRAPNDPGTRTVNALFKHVGLTAEEINELGREIAQQQPTNEQLIAQDMHRKEARAIKLNAGSLDITHRFNDWYLQRRHTIEYLADGNYFRVWVADNRRPGVRIELEGRSKGFLWFFSFYLVFLVESEEGHKDAILLLDEPGLHLHPTAQQELIAFFEKLSEKNQLIYTTHSPFLIDGQHLHRVRAVTEDETGHSSINAETWPSDWETIFPLQAAAGYAMLLGLFQHKKNVLVEGMSDFYYLHALSNQCHATNRKSLPDDVYIVPCGGTKLVGLIASLFLGQKVRPLVVLDGDEAGHTRRNALIKELYAEHLPAILMLDEVLHQPQAEIEDLLGEAVVVPAVAAVLGREFQLSAADRKEGSLPRQIKSAALRRTISLPKGWKASAALHLVSTWAEQKTRLSDDVLDRAATLFKEIEDRFREMDKPQNSTV